MPIQFIFSGIAGLVIAALTVASSEPAGNLCTEDGEGRYRIMFYNVENLFDVYDDSLTTDEEFTPSGSRHWTLKRYNTKLSNIYKVVIAAGGWRPPDIIGLCEVENRKVLQDLVGNTPFSKYDYRIVHENSSDRRGIDVAFIYNNRTVKYLDAGCFSIDKQDFQTRDIVYFKVLLGKDTCHLFANHWPSRSNGQLETEPDRFAAAHVLKRLTDSLFRINIAAKILIMGDFNDEPADKSMVYHLGAHTDTKTQVPGLLYNMTKAPTSGNIKGTLKYQGNWNIFDQMIVSGSFLLENTGLSVGAEGFKILDTPFLLTVDERYNGFKPFRTYNGYRYHGGFSDHLPVYIDLVKE